MSRLLDEDPSEDAMKIVRTIPDRIREATAKNESFVSFDFTGGSPLTSRLVQRTLVNSGYVSFVVIGSKQQTDRLYIDMKRRTKKKEQ